MKKIIFQKSVVDSTSPCNDVHYVGMDISKATLQVAFNGSNLSFDNTPQGHQKLIHTLSSDSGAHVICEATGGYEKLVVRALQQASIPVSVVNPLRVHHFIRYQGQVAKTDKEDAKLLALYGQSTHPVATLPLTPKEAPPEYTCTDASSRR